MSKDGSLWIGGLEEYMDDDFIMKAINTMGETYSGIVSIKIVKNKLSGKAAGYGFLNFVDDAYAIALMHKLNGKRMPGTSPPRLFKLNHNSNLKAGGFSIWVGDLSPAVDDYQVFRFFSARFPSVKSARVMLDETGRSKGFGFVRFGDQKEQLTALQTMQNREGLGEFRLKVDIAHPQSKDGPASDQIPALTYQGGPPHPPQPPQPGQPAQDYTAQWDQYNQYWEQYSQYAWQQWYASQQQPSPAPDPPPPLAQTGPVESATTAQQRNKEPVQHGLGARLAVEERNETYIQQSGDLFTALEDSCWTDLPLL